MYHSTTTMLPPSSEHRPLLLECADTDDVRGNMSISIDDVVGKNISSDPSASSSRDCWSWWRRRRSWQSYRRCRRRRPTRDDDECPSRDRRWNRGIFEGQLISFALSCANASSSSLANDYRVMMPTLLTGCVYSLLSLHYLVRRMLHHHRNAGDCIREHRGDNQPTTMDDVAREVDRLCVSGEETNDDAIVAITMSSSSSSSSSSYSHIGVIDIPPPPPAMERRRRSETDAAETMTTTSSTRRRRIFPFAYLFPRAPWHAYAILSVLDVEANYLAMLSFRHTTLSSSMLLTSLSVLSTVALRRLIPPRRRPGDGDEKRLGGRRILGVALCLIGGCSWLRREFRLGGGDVVVDDDEDDMLNGDLLALAAACVYGLNDVLAEYYLKASDDDGAEYVGMIGLFGALFSFCVQAPLLGEWDRARILLDGMNDVSGGIESDRHFGGVLGPFARPTTASTITLSFLCFVVMLFYFYTSAMAYMRLYDSTSLNLSLQSGPLWAVLLTMIRKSPAADGGSGMVGIPPAMFYASFAMIVAGMFLYETETGKDVPRDGNISNLSKSAKLICSVDYGSTELI